MTPSALNHRLTTIFFEEAQESSIEPKVRIWHQSTSLTLPDLQSNARVGTITAPQYKNAPNGISLYRIPPEVQTALQTCIRQGPSASNNDKLIGLFRGIAKAIIYSPMKISVASLMKSGFANTVMDIWTDLKATGKLDRYPNILDVVASPISLSSETYGATKTEAFTSVHIHLRTEDLAKARAEAGNLKEFLVEQIESNMELIDLFNKNMRFETPLKNPKELKVRVILPRDQRETIRTFLLNPSTGLKRTVENHSQENDHFLLMAFKIIFPDVWIEGCPNPNSDIPKEYIVKLSMLAVEDSDEIDF